MENHGERRAPRRPRWAPCPAFPLAHETSFQSGHRALDWSFAVEPATLLLLAAVLSITIAVRLLSATWNGADVPFLGRLAPWMPFAVRVHLAVALVGLRSMATGYRVRQAAPLLVAAGPLGMLEFGVAPVLQRGGHARVGGLPPLHRRRPLVGRRTARPAATSSSSGRAGGIEVLLGLLLISGALPQVPCWSPGCRSTRRCGSSAPMGSWGTCPISGAMLVLLVHGSDPALRAAAKAAWPFERRRRAVGVTQPALT